ncbi:MAG: tripartite tricarboxylate transporter substrate binding protein [Limnohabitans sp.]|jgi:tripartite-type tricarboxylate transporter receptor subunit TctC|nr:tripartite tricarboxylate transporter substrate binding protein [Limnohabitans sp.]
MRNLSLWQSCGTVLMSSVLFFAGHAASADVYPSKPIKLIVPFAPGSSTDVLGRMVADRLTRSLGQPVVIDSRPGAGGMIGTIAGAKAAADGYTLIMAGSGPFGVNPAIYSKLGYDPLKDFTPIANLVLTPQVMVATSNGPAKPAKQFLADAQAGGKLIDYASIGPGSTSHLAGAFFQRVSGLPMNHIAFKSNAEAQMQVIAGNVPVMFDAMPGVMTSIKAGKLRALAVASRERSPYLPDVPTFAEAGLGTLVVTGWIGLAAPTGTPEPILDKLNAEVNAMLQQFDVREKLSTGAFITVGGTRAEFGAYIRSEIAQWSQVAKQAGIQLD